MVQGSGTTTLTMQPANAQYGDISVSDDGRFVAYGAYVGEFDSGYYLTKVVDLSTNTTVASLRIFTPGVWLSDGRLIVGEGDQAGTSSLSPTFTSPVKLFRIRRSAPSGCSRRGSLSLVGICFWWTWSRLN